ncbi:adhesive plaque matrix protein-like [Paramacrobiotus metropolitanus]|uniref:adhesive plaque matrix protein-like n=1 Tax=Paramacrobiotus metropolitanus TaxID=2943436 RepID=UPI002445EA75|nr:adhesive plaque matrix protein-like [Paramacrobiotus metropolitanus]
MYNNIMLDVARVAMPLMGLSGLWPLFVHCQLFGAPSIPFPNYAGQNPLSGLFSLLGFGSYPPLNPGSYPPPFPPSYRSDPPFYQPPPPPPPGPPAEYSPRYFPPPPAPYSYSSNNVVLPKLPSKYDIGVFKSAADSAEKSSYPNSHYGYKYDPYPVDPLVYPTKPLYDKSGAYYKSVYPKTSLTGSPYGNYREFLKALLSGPPASPYMPSYSQNIPSVKAILEGDYGSIIGKSPPAAAIYVENAKPAAEMPYGAAPSFPPMSEQKVVYSLPVGEKPVAADNINIKEMYSKQFPDGLITYQKPLPTALAQKPTIVYAAAEPDRPATILSAPSTNPYALGLGSYPYTNKKPIIQQEMPMVYQEKFANYPDIKTIYQMPSFMPEKKPLVAYEQIPYQNEQIQQQQRMPATAPGYDLYPVFNNVGLKQPIAYQAAATVTPPGQDITYETDSAPSKPANYPTYFTATKAEYKRDPVTVQEKKSPPPMDESYSPAKYPTLGYEVDREHHRKPVPAIIAALFGGGKLGKSLDSSGEQFPSASMQAKYETAPVRQGYFSAPVAGYEDNPTVKQMVANQQSSGRYQQSPSSSNSPVDIFIPIGRSSKHTGNDPIKTIMH